MATKQKKTNKSEISIKNRHLIFGIFFIVSVIVFISGITIYNIGYDISVYNNIAKYNLDAQGVEKCKDKRCIIEYVINNTETMSIEECDKSPYPDECKSMLLREKAIKEKDASLCEGIPSQNERDSCYFSIYLLTDNTAYCTYIKDGTLKEMCLKE